METKCGGNAERGDPGTPEILANMGDEEIRKTRFFASIRETMLEKTHCPKGVETSHMESCSFHSKDGELHKETFSSCSTGTPWLMEKT